SNIPIHDPHIVDRVRCFDVARAMESPFNLNYLTIEACCLLMHSHPIARTSEPLNYLSRLSVFSSQVRFPNRQGMFKTVNCTLKIPCIEIHFRDVRARLCQTQVLRTQVLYLDVGRSLELSERNIVSTHRGEGDTEVVERVCGINVIYSVCFLRNSPTLFKQFNGFGVSPYCAVRDAHLVECNRRINM